MVFAGQFAIPFFDIPDFGAFFNPEDFVLVFVYGNLHHFPMRVLTLYPLLALFYNPAGGLFKRRKYRQTGKKYNFLLFLDTL